MLVELVEWDNILGSVAGSVPWSLLENEETSHDCTLQLVLGCCYCYYTEQPQIPSAGKDDQNYQAVGTAYPGTHC